MATKVENALKPGTTLVHRDESGDKIYTIIRTLGGGGFGITYLVKGYAGNIPVKLAIKEHFMKSLCERDGQTMSVNYSAPVAKQVKDSLRDFITEATRLNKQDVRHPNIIAIDDVFEANNTAYYVMQYIDGPSLSDYVNRVRGGKPLPEKDALELMRPVLDALSKMHEVRITHLDMKPDNILLATDEITGEKRPIIIDFGLSKHYDEEGHPTSTVNTLACSNGYSPIEQYSGITKFSPEADVYACAATIFFLLTGHAPEKAPVDTPEIADELKGKCSKPVEEALLRAFNNNSRRRTQTVTQFAEELGIPLVTPPKPVETVTEESETELVTPEPPQPPKREPREPRKPQPPQPPVPPVEEAGDTIVIGDKPAKKPAKKPEKKKDVVVPPVPPVKTGGSKPTDDELRQNLFGKKEKTGGNGKKKTMLIAGGCVAALLLGAVILGSMGGDSGEVTPVDSTALTEEVVPADSVPAVEEGVAGATETPAATPQQPAADNAAAAKAAEQQKQIAEQKAAEQKKTKEDRQKPAAAPKSNAPSADDYARMAREEFAKGDPASLRRAADYANKAGSKGKDTRDKLKYIGYDD